MRSSFALMLALAVLGGAMAGAQEAQDPMVQLPSVSRVTLTTWLQRDCSQGISPGEIAQLRALSGDVVGALGHAFERGLPDAELALMRARFETDFDKRAETLQRDGDRLFGRDAAARLRSVDKVSYVRRRLGEATLNYRTNALLALGVRGGPEARTLLERFAAASDANLSAVARDALKSMAQ